jgi:hypothetical protein
MKNKRLYYIVAIIVVTVILAPLVRVVKAQDEPGKIIAKIDFDPKSDGFSFQNYGSKHDGSGDMDASDLIMIFGADKVCIEGSTAEDCVLYETAEQWLEDGLQGMDGGHCDGFSVTTMRTWLNLPFRGKIEPKQWQANAEVTNDLEFDGNLANYIAHYHILQGLKEVSAFRMKTFKIPPTGIIKLLVESFQTGKEYYTLGIGMRINGKYEKGHSILPFAVEDMGDNEYRIHVYDNNYPGQTKYVMVDGNTETWRYHTASDPSKTANDYVGNKKTETMSLKKMSDRNLKKYQCPFCEENEGSGNLEGSAGGPSNAGSTSSHHESITFSFGGDGDLLITDPNGKEIGYDEATKSEVNQIPEAEIVYKDDEADFEYSPDYVLPYDEKAETPYQITISGKDIEQEGNSDLQISAPGFVVGFEDISLDPNEDLTVSVSPDGKTLSFTASADGETPTIFVTTEDGPDQPSYSFDVGGIKLEAGKTLTLTVDLKAGKLFFRDDDGNEDAFDVKFERTNPDGTKNDFEEDDMDIGKGDSYEMDFGKWDGHGKMEFKEDQDGDGFDDEKPVQLDNEYKPKPKKP